MGTSRLAMAGEAPFLRTDTCSEAALNLHIPCTPARARALENCRRRSFPAQIAPLLPFVGDFRSRAFPPNHTFSCLILTQTRKVIFEQQSWGHPAPRSRLGINSISPGVALICARCPQPQQQEINGAWGYPHHCAPPLIAVVA